MTKLLLSTLFTLFVAGISAQNILFPTQPGTILLYQQKNEQGRFENYLRYTITTVEGSGNNMTISYRVETLDENRQVTSEIPGRIDIRNGKMIFDIEQMIAPHVQNLGSGAEVEFSGSFMEMPVSMSPGQRFDDTEGTINIRRGILRIRVRMSVTDAKCIAIEDVTVPAGTFRSYNTTQTINNTILRITNSVRLVSWYAHGIGTVKSRTYNERGQLQSRVELVEVVRP